MGSVGIPSLFRTSVAIGTFFIAFSPWKRFLTLFDVFDSFDGFGVRDCSHWIRVETPCTQLYPEHGGPQTWLRTYVEYSVSIVYAVYAAYAVYHVYAVCAPCY